MSPNRPDGDASWLQQCEPLIAWFDQNKQATVDEIMQHFGGGDRTRNKLAWLTNRQLITVNRKLESSTTWTKCGGWSYPKIMEVLRGH